MQALSDEQQMERLEKKVDDGFAEMRAEFRGVRAEFRSEDGKIRDEMGGIRAEIGAIHRSIQAMWLTMILGFAGIVVAMLAHI